MKTSKTIPMTTQLFDEPNLNLCVDVEGANTYKRRLKVAAAWCLERHKVYLKKESGQPSPWTKDYIIQSSRFCNVYRELDKVTVQIMERWIRPNLDNPNLACLAILGRVINHPPTLDALVDAGVDFRSKPQSARVLALFNKLKGTQGQLVTGAYIVNTVFPRGFENRGDGTKAAYIANCLLPELWEHQEHLAEGLNSGSFRECIQSMKVVHGIATFMANQAAVDLTYTRWLSQAKDIDTTWNPGPGTTKGIRWITQDYTLRGGTEEMNVALDTYLKDVNALLSKSPLWSANTKDMRTNVVPLSGPNASNSLCEAAKYYAVALGERERTKQRYPGH